jgi:hypothetical protein
MSEETGVSRSAFTGHSSYFLLVMNLARIFFSKENEECCEEFGLQEEVQDV